MEPLLRHAAVDERGIVTVTPVRLPALNGVPHPFPYQGSKRALAHAVLPCLPADTDRLIEPFAGSAAISIAVRHADVARQAVVNDVNAPLMALWQAILDDPDDLSDAYASMWHAAEKDPRSFFLDVRREFNAAPTPAALLYLLNRIVKGAVRYSRSGEFNQSADHRRLGARPATVRERLRATSATMAGAVVRCGSFETVLLEAGPRDVVYLDPPYQGVSGASGLGVAGGAGGVADRRYLAGLTRADLERTLQAATARDVAYVVSYDAVRDDNRYGRRLDESLGLTHVHLMAGRSAQATLGGGSDITVESLYLSPALVTRLQARGSLSYP